VLRENSYKDSGKILTVLTSTLGKLTVSARGTKRRGSRTAPCTQPLAFSDMTLLRNRDRWTLTEAQGREFFPGLSRDLAPLALGTYFAELLEAVSDEDSPGDEILPLGLNALYAVSEGKRPERLIKAAFELRLMCLAGFRPNLDSCGVCGGAGEDSPALQIEAGSLCCGACLALRGAAGGGFVRLDAPSLHAARYITRCDPRRVFSFTLEAESLRKLADAAERYALAHLDRGFRALDYYREVAQ
jgi:DNA repair protein RecO (recombination protein O)